ncbi:MAG: hypothetical protein SFV15_13580 [Polyangiaceae bacterium]|nr:hypothetical protein [Polyangiaceae bacterium]
MDAVSGQEAPRMVTEVSWSGVQSRGVSEVEGSLSAAAGHPRIRVGVVLPGETVSAWQAKVIRGILESGDVECALVVLCDTPRQKSFFGSSPQGRRGSLFQAYEWLDRKLTKSLGGTTDAFEQEDASEMLRPLPLLPLSEDGYGTAEGRLKHAALDVLLDLQGDVPAALARHAKYGIWSLELGDGPGFGRASTAFREMLDGRRVGITQLLVTLENGEKRTIYRSFSRLHEFSLHMNQNLGYWKASEFALRRLSALRTGGWGAIESLATFREGPIQAGFHESPPPSSAEVIDWCGEFARRAAKRVALDLSTQKSWRIGWRRTAQQSGGAPGPFNFIIPPRDRFYADPSLVRHQGRTYMFFEDYVRKQGRALISWVSIDEANSQVTEPKVAFATEDHLSYPYVFTWEGEVYIIPERRAKRRIELWRALAFPHEWVFDRVLIDSLDAVDATWFQANDRFWILANIAPKGATSAADELHLFYSRNPFGPFTRHPQNPLVSNVRGARPGGRVFLRNGALIRPGQDSSERYGGRIILHQIDELSEEHYAEHEVGTIEADWFDGCLGTHTYDCDGHIEVLDGFERAPRNMLTGALRAMTEWLPPNQHSSRTGTL